MTPMKTKDRLVQAAIELTAESGIEKVSVRRIAERLDLSEATLYRHFVGMDDLLSYTFLRIDNRISSLLMNHAEEIYQKYSDLTSATQAIWEIVFHYLLDHPEETLFLIRFRYSAQYTPEVRSQRMAYNGTLDKVLLAAPQTYPIWHLFYQGFLLNYIFELTLSFAEKMITGRLPKNEETMNVLWNGIKGCINGLLSYQAEKK